MADLIKCPVCGENNRPDQEFCQNCQTRLGPLPGSSRDGDEILKPGQAPTKKNTAELEPILPQWLKDARDSARNLNTGDPQAEQPPQKPQPASPVDFLAGLQSQSHDGDEEDIPDWLASLTGDAPKPKKAPPESSEVRWVEMGAKNDFAQDEQPAGEPDAPPWLSGLASTPQPDEKDELTDWFRDASGIQKPPAQEPQPEASSADTPDWLRAMAAESDVQDSFTPSNESNEMFGGTSTSGDTPDWLRAMAAESDPQVTNAPSNDSNDLFGASSASTDTPDWLRSMSADGGAQASNAPTHDENDLFGSASNDTPDWLRSMSTDGGQSGSSASVANESDDLFGASSASSNDTPDWLRSMAADSGAQSTNVPSNDAQDLFGDPSASSNDTPDWLRSMSADSGVQSSVPSDDVNDLFGAPTDSNDAPDWLRGVQSQNAEPAGFSEPASSGIPESSADLFAGDVPDWLKGAEPEKSAPASSSDQEWLASLQTGGDEKTLSDQPPAWAAGAGATSGDELEMPSWLSGAKTSESAAPAQDDSLGDVPSWLKASAPQESMFGETPAAMPASAESASMPDWLNSIQSVEPESSSKPADAQPTFADNSGGNIDELFTDLPDWLSNAGDTATPASSSPAPITNTDAIAPGELPSWVQAMRPVDSGVPSSSAGSLSSDQTLESRGALAGLQGVLPAVPGFSPASKPKAYSIRLQASDEQQAHAALLEQILAAETAPVPLSSFTTLKSSRGLRWFLVALFFLILPVILIMRTQVFTLPLSEPTFAVRGALDVAQLLPEGAPVLVAFDFEPARAGEMETIAAPMFDQMLLLHHPRFTFISTSESGAVLAERFISTGPLAGHQYQSGIEYMNLGYLPGGPMGIHAFAQDPRRSTPYLFNSGITESVLFNFNLTPAWTADPWSNITSLSQFTAFVIVTDNADSARAWIEQTSSARGTIPVVVISSAQAAPMIRPYYDSQQISGMISGLYDGAVFEQNNLNRPGTTRVYWDAYNIGLLLAMALIVLGGLWNFVLGLRDRAAAREAK